MPGYAVSANASSKLIKRPTSAPVSTGGNPKETLQARKPIAKRLENACNNIPVVRSGWLPKTVINTSAVPNVIPDKTPRTVRFMKYLVHDHRSHRQHFSQGADIHYFAA